MRSFVSLEPSSLVLTSIKKAEDSNDWIVQWYNTAQRAEDAILTLPQAAKQVVLSDFLEQNKGPVSVSKNTVRVHTAARGVVTVRVGL